MISLIQLICSESYRAVQLESVSSSHCLWLFPEKELQSYMHLKWGYINAQSVILSSCREGFLLFNGIIRVLIFMFFFSAVVRVCWVKAGHNLLPQSSDSSIFPFFFATSIRLQWTITALWGVDTFSCSSICGVVINFLPVIGLSYNILRLGAACSAAINHKTQTFHLYHLETFAAAATIWRGRGARALTSIKKMCGSSVIIATLVLLQPFHKLRNYSPNICKP